MRMQTIGSGSEIASVPDKKVIPEPTRSSFEEGDSVPTIPMIMVDKNSPGKAPQLPNFLPHTQRSLQSRHVGGETGRYSVEENFSSPFGQINNQVSSPDNKSLMNTGSMRVRMSSQGNMNELFMNELESI